MSPSRSDRDAAAWTDLTPVPPERDMPPDRRQVIREHLLSEFRASGAAALTPRMLRVSRWRPIRLSRRVVTVGGLAAAAVTAIIIVVITVFNPKATTGAPSQAACAAPYRNGSVPFPNGYETTVARAQSAVGFPIPLPHNAQANQQTLSQVWVSQGSRLVALIYGNGKVKILLQPWPVTPSPEKWFRYERGLMIKGSAMAGRVNGNPALIVQPDVGSCHSNPALVEFYRSGIDVDVSSSDYGTTMLLVIAQSMR